MTDDTARRASGELALVALSQPVSRYDFREAQWAPKPLVESVCGLYSATMRSVAAQLSGYLGIQIAMAQCSAGQVLFGTYAGTVSRPAFLAAIRIRPGTEQGVLELSPEVVRGFLRIMLADGTAASADGPRELTEIELHVLTGVLEIVVRELCKNWGASTKLVFDLNEVVSSAESCRIGQGEMVVAVTAELLFRGETGRMTLLLPARLVRAVMNRRQAATAEGSSREQMLRLAKRAQVNMDARLQNSRILAGDLLQLQPGQVLMLPHPAGKPVALAINGEVKFKGQVVAGTGKALGFQIEQRLETHV